MERGGDGKIVRKRGSRRGKTDEKKVRRKRTGKREKN